MYYYYPVTRHDSVEDFMAYSKALALTTEMAINRHNKLKAEKRGDIK